MNNRNREERGYIIAELLATIPPFVWGAFLILLFAFIGLSVYFNHNNLQPFTSQVLHWLLITVIVVGVYILVTLLYKGYNIYHDVQTKRYERKSAKAKAERQVLQNELLRAKVDVAKQLPQVIKYAMENGHNVEYEGLKVTSYLSNIHAIHEGTPAKALPAPDVPLYVPQPYTFSEVLQNWTPTKDGILLGKNQQLITAPIGEGLCHTTSTGNTDAGKTNIERLLLIQLLYLQQCCYLCDRNYQTFRQDKKLNAVYDYRPIEAKLAHEPIDNSKTALALLKHLASELDDRRIARRKAIVKFRDIYLVMDELPAFANEEPEIMQYVGKFARESRQYGIFFIGAAQDLLNNTLNNDNGAIRDNFLTNFFGGGDDTTARMVLNLAKGETIDKTGLGKQGCFYVRAKGADIEREKVRVPLSDNNATLTLLGDLQPLLDTSGINPFRSALILPSRPVQAQTAVLEPDIVESDDSQEEQSVKFDDPQLEMAYQLFTHGTTTARDVGSIMKIGKSKANELLNTLQAMGLIVRP